jgi:hypothetical protein
MGARRARGAARAKRHGNRVSPAEPERVYLVLRRRAEPGPYTKETDVDNDFDNAKKLVEATIRELGLDPATTQANQSDSSAAWTLKRGSASILVTVAKHMPDCTTYVRVAASVVTLPADAGKHLAICRRLLELNAAGLANAAFGLAGDRVIVVSERPAAGLDGQEVDQMVRHLAAVADTFDDRLENEFGATKA